MSSKAFFECSVGLENKTLSLADDCIGAVVPFKFGNNKYEIHFPNFDTTKVDVFGHPQVTSAGTKITLNWIRNQPNNDENYGFEHTSDKDGNVKGFSLSTLIIKSASELTETEALVAKKELAQWQRCFGSWIEAYEYLDLEENGLKVEQDTTVRAYLLSDVGQKPKSVVDIPEGAHIYITKYEDLSQTRIMPALTAAASGDYPPGYYSLLISGLRHLHRDEYRVCLLDAATAVEMALTELLDRQLTNMTLIQKQIFIDKHLGIHNIRDALKKLGITTSNDLQSQVGSPRNKAIHKGELVNKDMAQDALMAARVCLYADLAL